MGCSPSRDEQFTKVLEVVGERVAAGGEGWRKEPGASKLENTTMGFLHSAVSSV